MKRLILPAILLITILGSSFRCNKGEHSNNHQLTGKLVIQAACGHFVIQVLKGDIDPSNVIASYTDSGSNKTYTNVFTVKNNCSFEKLHMPYDTPFTFELDPNGKDETCVWCFIYYPVPGVYNGVKNVNQIRALD